MIIVTSIGQGEYEEKGERPIAPSDSWPTMSLADLLEQKNIMYDRWEFIRSKGFSYEKQFLEGLQRLEKLIESKLAEQLTS